MSPWLHRGPVSSWSARACNSPRAATTSNIELASEDQLPQDAQLVFSVRAKSPATFGRDATIEVASEDEAFSTSLSLANRGLTLADAKVAVATFDPAKAFGFSAFGPLKFRVVNKGVAGDWQPLGHARAIARAAGTAMPGRSRAALQAHGLQLVPRGLCLRRSASSTMRWRCQTDFPVARCPFLGPRKASSI